jgi:hypothetical protein
MLPLLLLPPLLCVSMQVLDATEVPKDFGAIYKYVYHGADSHSSSSDGGSNSGSSSSSSTGKS